MNEISFEMAKYLYNANREVFRLYDDGVESAVEKYDDIINHNKDGGIFGVENGEQ